MQDQGNNIKQDGSKALDAMHTIKAIGVKVKHALEKGDISEFGRLQDDHWQVKKSTSGAISNGLIDRWYALGLKNGALGGKLMGAGGGGFLMFYCENNKNKVRKAMSKEGLKEIEFGFEHHGSMISLNV